ncbi:Hypothetical protein POVR1_LOCUS261 [uncultured virus]|nr:Hypothetical protein POVR1_LOCUS261 [uncultured virus]
MEAIHSCFGIPEILLEINRHMNQAIAINKFTYETTNADAVWKERAKHLGIVDIGGDKSAVLMHFYHLNTRFLLTNVQNVVRPIQFCGDDAFPSRKFGVRISKKTPIEPKSSKPQRIEPSVFSGTLEAIKEFLSNKYEHFDSTRVVKRAIKHENIAALELLTNDARCMISQRHKSKQFMVDPESQHISECSDYISGQILQATYHPRRFYVFKFLVEKYHMVSGIDLNDVLETLISEPEPQSEENLELIAILAPYCKKLSRVIRRCESYNYDKILRLLKRS